jgi:hypothetical protein
MGLFYYSLRIDKHSFEDEEEAEAGFKPLLIPFQLNIHFPQ